VRGRRAYRTNAATWGNTDHRFHHQPLLGTVVEVRVPGACGGRVARRIDAAAVEEIARLEHVFSAFDPTSELERWKRGEVRSPSAEFSAAMRLALDWQERSGGTFNTSSGIVSAAWRKAEAAGEPPSTAELGALASSIAEPRFVIDGNGYPAPVGDCSGVNLNAFVKGWIADRAVQRARLVAPAVDVLVNAGGDLRHAGTSAIRIGIENPLRPYDNEPPVCTIELANAGLATSGRARRGFRIANHWYSHVIDPRSGQTVDSTSSISVVAHDAATADVLATIAGLISTDEALDYTEALGAACLIITPDGKRQHNKRWAAIELPGA